MNVGIKLKSENCNICIFLGYGINYCYILEACLSNATDGQLLRALELNSWQILRLLGAHLPGLLCGNPPCGGSGDGNLEINVCNGSIGEKLCCLFSKVVAFHDSWKDETSTSRMLFLS